MIHIGYINVSIYNSPDVGCLVINSIKNVTSLGTATKVDIYRKEGAGSFKRIKTISLSSVNDLTFRLVDLTTKSGYSYEYQFYVMGSETNLPVETPINTSPVKCSFEGLFIGNQSRQYIARANFKTEISRNTLAEYVTTLTEKYPYRISNAAANYTTGKSTGMFLRLADGQCRLVPDYDHSYSTEVLDFLTDGSSKVVKTHDGHAWYVSVDANPKEVYSEYIGAHLIEFSWTEIGDLSLMDVAGE